MTDLSRYPTAQALKEHLLEQLIAAVIATNPSATEGQGVTVQRPERRWKAAPAQRWLGYIARHLDRLGARDLAWWQLHLGTPMIAKTLAAAAGTVFMAALVGVSSGVLAGIGTGLVLGVLLGFPEYYEAKAPPEQLDLSVGQAIKESRLARGYLYGGIAALLSGLMTILAAWHIHTHGNVIGAAEIIGTAVLFAVLATSLRLPITHGPETACYSGAATGDRMRLLRRRLACSTRQGLTIGIPTGLVAGLVTGIGLMIVTGSANWLAEGLLTGAAFGLSLSIAVADTWMTDKSILAEIVYAIRPRPANASPSYAGLALSDRARLLARRLRAGFGYALAGGLILGPAIGLLLGMTVGGWAAIAQRSPSPMLPAIIVGLTAGGVFGVAWGLRHGSRAGTGETLPTALRRAAHGTKKPAQARSAEAMLPYADIRLRRARQLWITYAQRSPRRLAAATAIAATLGLAYATAAHAGTVRAAAGGFLVLLLAVAPSAEDIRSWAITPAPGQPPGTPESTLRGDRKLTVILAVLPAGQLGLLLGLLAAVIVPRPWPTDVLTGLVIGIAFALVLLPIQLLEWTQSTARPPAWPAYFLTVTWLALRRQLPWHVMTFLKDCCTLGLLIQRGPVYQFRHTIIQEHFRAEVTAQADDRQTGQ